VCLLLILDSLINLIKYKSKIISFFKWSTEVATIYQMTIPSSSNNSNCKANTTPNCSTIEIIQMTNRWINHLTTIILTTTSRIMKIILHWSKKINILKISIDGKRSLNRKLEVETNLLWKHWNLTLQRYHISLSKRQPRKSSLWI